MSVTPDGRRGVLGLLGLLGFAQASPAAAMQSPAQPAGPAPLDWRAVAARTRASTVAVLADRAQPLADALRGAGPHVHGSRYGSGIVVGAEGLILTNAHVVGNAARLAVLLPDGREVAAERVGTDAMADLALLRLTETVALLPIPMGRETPAEPGEPVLSVGAPFGLAGSVTAGIVSGLDRPYSASDPVGYLQHDAAINPGSSGGPVVDAAGRLLGINTAVPERERFDVGVALAIPAPLALRIAGELATHGQPNRAWLGVMVQELEPDLATALAAPPGGCLLVCDIAPGSPAEGRLAAGDLLLAAQGRPLAQVRDLGIATMAAAPGEAIALSVLRGGKPVELHLTATAMPFAAGAGAAPATVPLLAAEPLPHGLRFRVAPRARGGRPEPAVEIQEVQAGGGQSMGLRVGDLVLSVGATPVATPEAAEAAIAAAGPALVLRIRRGTDPARFVSLPRWSGGRELRGNQGGAFGGPY